MTMPEWRRRQLQKAKPYADWWRRRHHCSDGMVLGANHQLTSDVETGNNAPHPPQGVQQLERSNET